MSTIPFSRVVFNAFEQALSGDLTRIGALSSRELLSFLGNMATRDAMYDPLNNIQPAPEVMSDLIPGQSKLCGFGTNAGNLDVFVTPGEGYTDGILAADQAPYNVVRWGGTTLTLVPDTVHPRMNLVVARPAAALTNPVSRNILIDPVTRTVAVQTVYKTQDPAAAIVMLTGTPAALGTAGAAPLPPDGSIVSGDLVLAEILIPANATNSDACTIIRRSNRLVLGALNNYHGILQAHFAWTGSGDESSTDARPLTISSFPLRAIIDGELVETSDSTVAVPDNIGGQNPFAVGAPATNDAPYYVYLCGGRNKPQRSGIGTCPVVLVCSTVAPDTFGRPSALVGTPRGTTIAGALYVGVGFVIQNSNRGKRVDWDGDWVYARSGGVSLTPSGEHPVVFNQPSFRLVSGDATTNFDLPTLPATSTRARCALALSSAIIDPDVLGALYVSVRRNGGGGTQQMVAALSIPVGNRYGRGMVEFDVDPNGSVPLLTASMATIQDPATVELRVLIAAVAYNMKVPRLSP